MKKIILFYQLLLLINLFSQDGNIKKFNGLKRNISGYSMADFDFQGYYKKIKEFEEIVQVQYFFWAKGKGITAFCSLEWTAYVDKFIE